jgi:hypothetical protein
MDITMDMLERMTSQIRIDHGCKEREEAGEVVAA